MGNQYTIKPDYDLGTATLDMLANTQTYIATDVETGEERSVVAEKWHDSEDVGRLISDGKSTPR